MSSRADVLFVAFGGKADYVDTAASICTAHSVLLAATLLKGRYVGRLLFRNAQLQGGLVSYVG